ncbi:phage portal protein [Pseudomonas asplenii]|uniref:Phage portal protein, lambda family n=1 Tax=Pseudomonas asplenii TaxID=53407 RepID=A0A1H6NT56_9PSED|nr:phage portal protein [Pseudomonas fuscovaginae]SEI17180.1 phage portal protein, lambda family [Pseudomonas fuscovaginae]
MAWFTRSTPEEKVVQDAARVVSNLVKSQPRAQGGGGGSETRWRGASRMLRSMASWLPFLGSPNRDLSSPERKVLVARSRDAMRNHLIARAAIVRSRTNIVGTGLICRPQVDHEALGLTEEEGDALNAQLQREWELYAIDPRECDAESTLNHYQLQALALVSALTGGDCFVATPWVERPGTIFSTRLQLIETDRVSNPNGTPDTENCVEGIEFDQHGAPVAAYICNGYPEDKRYLKTPLRWDRVEFFGAETGRRRLLQVWCDKERPGLKRGAPYLAPILEPLQKLERYASAELMAAVISAMFTVFIKKGDNYNSDGGGQPVFGDEDPTAQSSGEPAPIELGEGAIVDLAQGEEPMIANPARPNAQFDPFFSAIVKEIGAALELPMEELMLHYSSSYSAARAAMLQAWRFYVMRRWWLVCDFCQPSYELMFDEAVALGRIRAPGYHDPALRKAYTKAIWIGPARGAIDEFKEAKAAQARIDAGISNETMETASMSGETWTQVNQQRARELAQRRANGTTSQPVQQPAAPEVPPDPPNDNED